MLLDYDSSDFDTGTQATTTTSNVPAPPATSSLPNWLAIGSAIENDILYAYRTITQPALPPGMAGVTVSGGRAGSQISASPILIVALIAVVWLVLDR